MHEEDTKKNRLLNELKQVFDESNGPAIILAVVQQEYEDINLRYKMGVHLIENDKVDETDKNVLALNTLTNMLILREMLDEMLLHYFGTCDIYKLAQEQKTLYQMVTGKNLEPDEEEKNLIIQ